MRIKLSNFIKSFFDKFDTPKISKSVYFELSSAFNTAFATILDNQSQTDYAQSKQ